jgi:hypothetical protein
MDERGKKIDAGKDGDRHPHDRKIEQPMAHG